MHRARPYLAQLPPTYLFFARCCCCCFSSFFQYARVLRLFGFLLLRFRFCVIFFPCCCWPASAAMTYKQQATCWSTKRCKFPLTLPLGTQPVRAAHTVGTSLASCQNAARLRPTMYAFVLRSLQPTVWLGCGKQTSSLKRFITHSSECRLCVGACVFVWVPEISQRDWEEKWFTLRTFVGLEPVDVLGICVILEELWL